MNARHLPVLALLASATLLSTPVAAAAPMTEAPTHEQVNARLQAQERNDPMKSLQTLDAGDPSEAARPKDLLETSDFLCFNGKATLVPKGAILATPARFQPRLRFAAHSTILTWSDFLALNRGWITGVEVTLDQACGRAALSEELTKRIGESSTVLVATHQGGPITVNPFKPAGAPEQTEATAQAPGR